MTVLSDDESKECTLLSNGRDYCIPILYNRKYKSDCINEKLTENGLYFFNMIINNPSGVEEYLKGMYSGDLIMLSKICEELEDMKKDGVLSFRCCDPEQNLAHQPEAWKELGLDFESLQVEVIPCGIK